MDRERKRNVGNRYLIVLALAICFIACKDEPKTIIEELVVIEEPEPILEFGFNLDNYIVKRDTIRKERVYTSFGFGHTTNKQATYWGTIGGKKGYFIMDYVMTYAIDQNSYYPYGQINNVDFPLSKEDWKKESTFYVGAGKRIGKIGIHGMIGFGNEVIRWQGKDDLGGISFPKSNTNFTTFKVGLIRDFKFVTLKVDTDPIRGYSQISIGLNNK